jgi:type IX secretion system PorP/SprF family membrane protein
MKPIFKTLCVVMLLSGCFRTFAQDIHFSQFYEMPVLRNPALAGMFIGDIRGTFAYRSQWNSIGAPYKTMAAGAEFKIPANEDRWLRQNIGLQITRDVAGDSKLSKTQVMPALNFHIPFNIYNNSILSVGFMGGLVLHSFDRSALTFDDQFVNGTVTGSSSQKFDYSNRTYFNGGIGAVYNYGGYDVSDTRYYFGVSVTNLAPNKKVKYFLDSMDLNRNIKIGFNAGGALPTGDYTRLNFYADYFRQSGNALVQFGALFTYDLLQDDLDRDEKISLTGGVLYRMADAVVPVARLEYYNLQVGLSYDANVSRLVVAGRSKNVFELTLSYKDFLNILNSTLNQLRCVPKRNR